MKSPIYFISVLVAGISFFTSCSSKSKKETPAQAVKTGSIQITDGWARPAAEGANSAAYLTVQNGKAHADTLRQVASDAAQMAEVHESYQTDNNMMDMRPAGKQAIAAGSKLILKPGGLHIMLMQLKKSLSDGDSLTLNLSFAHDSIHTVTVPVQLQP